MLIYCPQFQVKRRVRERQSSICSSNGTYDAVKEEKTVSRSRQSSISLSKNVTNDQPEDREELDFQFDEELDRPLPAVKQNTFTEWSDSESESEFEVGDDFINKVSRSRIT